MNSSPRCKRETTENETKSGAHTWQRYCAHAQLVARGGEIEITVSALHRRTYVRTYIYIEKLRVGCTTRWARSRSPNYALLTRTTTCIVHPAINVQNLKSPKLLT